jgi:hypothetical protein
MQLGAMGRWAAVAAALAAAYLGGMTPARGKQMTAELAKLAVERSTDHQSHPETDWLIRPPQEHAVVVRSADGKEIVLTNGLIRRAFRIAPNAATVACDNLMTGASMLRAVKPEAILEIDGKTYPVGGLIGQPDLAYLRSDWIDAMRSDPQAFRFTGFEMGKTRERFPWKRVRHSADLPWPAPGVSLALHFAPPAGILPGVTATVHYELYDGLPLLAKWVTLRNDGAKAIRLNSFVAERLGMVEREAIVDDSDRWEYPNITAVTDYSFGGMSVVNSTKTIFWEPDPDYGTQVNYNLKTPCVLEARPPLGPDVDIAAGDALDTFRVFELIHDSTDRERKGLAVRRMYRALAPWATENPLMMHLTSVNKETAHRAIDQCAECGFEMVILSFGSGLNMEDASPVNIARFKELADYAHSKHIELGGYSLLASRAISPQDDVINPKTGTTGGAIFGNSPCLGSKWGIEYFQHLQTFLDQTGFNLLEHDGSYPGDKCASTTHPGHRGLEDSQWTQYQRIAAFYRRCRERGVFLNVPDWYFLVGSNKTGMGYRETNWSLPRAQQHIHARQNLFDGTWEKTPTMGWMFVPLVEYQGGGPAATIEPLKDHLADYEQHLANNLGYGAQACYRGPRLYDSEETKAAVKKWVTWFKAHRAILESDVIHLRRADARDLDGILHVNPNLPEKGLAVLYNPTDHAIEKEIKLPLYYTGLQDTAHIAERGAQAHSYALDRDHIVRLKVTIPPAGMTWFVIR